MKKGKYLAVNWVDGVKITKDHFVDSYYNSVDTVRDYATTRIRTYNYGLLEARKDMDASIEIETQTHTQERLVLKLKACNAITSRGCRIEFSSKMYGNESPTATIESANIDVNSTLEYYLILIVNPFELVPVGEPDPEVIPLHHPNVLPKIGLSIIPQSKFNNNFMETYFLLAGKIQWKNGDFIIDSNYIPPTTKIKYQKRLHSFHEKICQVLIRLRNNSIIINKKNRDKIRNNKLVSNTFLLCNKVMNFVSQYSFEFNQIGEEQSPIFIAGRISILANYMSNELAIMKVVEKENILQYYYEWTDVKPSDFETALGDIIDMTYDHLDINDMVKKVDYFIAILDRLWKKLSELEYIGQRRDNIVISEDEKIDEVKSKNTWSIID